MRTLVVGLALAASIGMPARAALVEALDLADLCHDATLVVHGVVAGEESEWRDGHIVTRVTITVRRVLKGKAGPVVVVSHLGGVVGTIGQIAPGEAQLATGEEVVLFLEPMRGELRVVGMAQGVFHVGPDGQASQHRAGLTLVGRSVPQRSLPLRALLAAIAQKVRR